MRIVIPGQPIPKARARTFVRGGYTQTFDPQYKKKKEIQKQIEALATEYYTEEPLSISYEFHFKPATTNTPGERNLKLWGLPHTQKPDCTNLCKMYEDAMNGIVYADDSQIVETSMIKKFAQNPCTIIEISVKNYLDVSNNTKEVLKIMSPDEMTTFARDCNTIWYYQEKDIADCAVYIKEFADKWAKTLNKISKCKADFTSEEKPYSTGKTLS